MEHEILLLLQCSAGIRYSYKEVGRRLDRKQFRENVHWARPFLERLAEEGAIEKQDQLYYFPEFDSEEDEVDDHRAAGP